MQLALAEHTHGVVRERRDAGRVQTQVLLLQIVLGVLVKVLATLVHFVVKLQEVVVWLDARSTRRVWHRAVRRPQRELHHVAIQKQGVINDT